MKELTHPEARQLLQADHPLQPEERRALETHLSTCRECREYAALHNRLETALQTPWSQRPLSNGEFHQTIESIGTQVRRQRMFKRITNTGRVGLWAVLILGAIFTITWLFGALKPTIDIQATLTPSATMPFTPTAILEIILPTETLLPPTMTSQPRKLNICLGAEPDTIHTHLHSMYVSRAIREAVFDGPIDNRGYAYHPVILEKLPSLADGDAVVETITVQAGDQVVDSDGEIITLTSGAIVRPSGCRQDDCAITYAGGALEMDQLSAAFTLLDDLKWSDGEPLTAADSVFSYQIAKECEDQWGRCGGGALTYGSYRLATIDRTASYTALDLTTTRWVGLPGFLDQGYQTNFFTPFPLHRWENYSVQEIVEAEDANRKPLGWGPYRIVNWEAGERITLLRNPYYFRADEGLPYFDQLTFIFIRYFPTLDFDSALAGLQAGDCDLLSMDTYPEQKLDEVMALAQSGDLELRTIPVPIWEQLTFGINSSPTYTQPNFFGDLRTRQAVAHCIDRPRIVEQVFNGFTTIAEYYIPPTHPLYPPTGLASYPYDPEAGMALLEEVGWRDTTGDGLREARGVAGILNGTLMKVNLYITESQIRAQVTTLIAEDLAACGIEATLIPIPSGELFENSPESPYIGMRFDLVQHGWITGIFPPCDLYLSTQIPGEANQWAGANYGGYINPAFDAACQAAQGALPGTADFVNYHQEALRIFSQDLPSLPLYMRYYLFITRPDLAGVIVQSAQSNELWNLEAFYLLP